MREETLAIVRRMQDNEATDQRVYAALAKQASLQKNSETLKRCRTMKVCIVRYGAAIRGLRPKPTCSGCGCSWCLGRFLVSCS